MRRFVIQGILFLYFACLAAGARAQVIGTSARQLSPGSLKTLFYYQGTQGQDLNFNVNGSGTCTSAPPASLAFPCGTSGNVAAEGSGGALMFKLIYQPWDSLQYYASVGVGDYSLRVASVSVVNSLTGDRPGILYGAGVRSVLVPDTIVSPAIAVDAGVGWQSYSFNELRPGSTAAEGQANQRLDMMQTQVAMEASHLFKLDGERWSVEPYGGVKWLRSQAWLKDIKNGGRVGGIQDAVTPFLGLQFPVYEHEGLFAEASFVHGYQYSAGLNIRFDK